MHLCLPCIYYYIVVIFRVTCEVFIITRRACKLVSLQSISHMIKIAITTESLTRREFQYCIGHQLMLILLYSGLEQDH